MGSSEMIEESGVRKLELDKEAGKLWYYSPKDINTKRNVSNLGAGSQSMLLMIMSAMSVDQSTILSITSENTRFCRR